MASLFLNARRQRGGGLLRALALVVEAIWPSYAHWKQLCDMMSDLQPFEIILGGSVVDGNWRQQRIFIVKLYGILSAACNFIVNSQQKLPATRENQFP